MKLGQELAAIGPAFSLKAYSIHLGDIQGTGERPVRQSYQREKTGCCRCRK
jgi:hypothetical protein